MDGIFLDACPCILLFLVHVKRTAGRAGGAFPETAAPVAERFTFPKQGKHCAGSHAGALGEAVVHVRALEMLAAAGSYHEACGAADTRTVL